MHIPPNLLALSTLTLSLTVSPISCFAKPSPSPPLQPHSRTSLPAAFFPKYNSQRVKLTYGPYTVPPMSVDNGMLAFGGQIVESPCTDCMITYMHAGLTYADGSPATADTGIWLHHTVWMNLGRPDAPASCCSDDDDDEEKEKEDEEETSPLGHHHRHRFHRAGDRFFASGNERTPVDFTRNGTLMAGYRIGSSHEDTIAMGGELMNMDMDEQEVEVFLTMEIEYVPSHPSEWRDIESYWLDVGACSERGSNMPAYNDTVWELDSPPVKVPVSRNGHGHGRKGKKHDKDGRGKGKAKGEVVFIAAHLHDGGVRAEIARDGAVVCESVATYSPSTMDASTSYSSASSEQQQKSHIANLSTCADAEALGSTEPGDEWTVRAYYDTTLHAPMANMDGSLEPVMGIALVYVAVDAESGGHRHHHHNHRSKKMKVFLAVGILGLSGLLWGTWTAMHGRDWRGRRRVSSGKNGRVQLYEAGGYADMDGKSSKQLEEEEAAAAWDFGRYQDNE